MTRRSLIPLNQWDALCYYSDDGLAEADNNAAERALRAVCLGKKNYIFFGSDHGGERGARLHGLIGTCRLNGIDPGAYLRYILSVLPEWPSNKVAELLPWNVDLTNYSRQYAAHLTLTMCLDNPWRFTGADNQPHYCCRNHGFHA